MSYLEIFVTFMIVWWSVLFMVLPFGSKWDKEGETSAGLAQSSPANPRLKIKFLITTALTIIITTITYFVLSN